MVFLLSASGMSLSSELSSVLLTLPVRRYLLTTPSTKGGGEGGGGEGGLP